MFVEKRIKASDDLKKNFNFALYANLKAMELELLHADLSEGLHTESDEVVWEMPVISRVI